jgi:hypothetical protein
LINIIHIVAIDIDTDILEAVWNGDTTWSDASGCVEKKARCTRRDTSKCPTRGSSYGLWRINGKRGTEKIEGGGIRVATWTPSDPLGYAISTGLRISMITHPWRGGRNGFDESMHIARQRQSDAPEKIESDGIGFATWTLSDLLGYAISTSLEISMMNARRGYYNSLNSLRKTYPKQKQPAASIN